MSERTAPIDSHLSYLTNQQINEILKLCDHYGIRGRCGDMESLALYWSSIKSLVIRVTPLLSEELLSNIRKAEANYRKAYRSAYNTKKAESINEAANLLDLILTSIIQHLQNNRKFFFREGYVKKTPEMLVEHLRKQAEEKNK